MAKRVNITDEARAEASRRLANFFAFTEDVLADPSILDQMPDASHIDPIPKEECEPGRHYDVETPRMVATVTPVQPDDLEDRTSA